MKVKRIQSGAVIVALTICALICSSLAAETPVSASSDSAKKVVEKTKDTAKTGAKIEPKTDKSLGKAKSPARNDTVTTETGLKYIVTQRGKGVMAKVGSTVGVHYVGRLTDGKEFDNTIKRGTPIEFMLGTRHFIPGLDEGVSGMMVGEKRTLIIPPKLGFGERGGAGGLIPPNATLVFEVELMSIR